MDSNSSRIAEWERQRREALAGLVDALDAGHLDLDADPLSFLAIFDDFVASQEYDSMDDDDWRWLHTMLAAYVAQVLIVEHGAAWDLISDDQGANYILTLRGRDGLERSVSPMDIVYDDLKRWTPPEVPRILAAAESAIGIGIGR
ncbi:hypothetical protein [Nocardia suismassiliense]|uniref:hypothetical protein n=1 Tax=Nocardia suismassiliense TaxID=2077092 RepID=UPI00131F23FA|nr:hypothetical protein [Nocardia suismassiliense]